jgi:hypothetical protein
METRIGPNWTAAEHGGPGNGMGAETVLLLRCSLSCEHRLGAVLS